MVNSYFICQAHYINNIIARVFKILLLYELGQNSLLTMNFDKIKNVEIRHEILYIIKNTSHYLYIIKYNFIK